MKVHFIIHECFEGPAAIEIWAKKNNHTITYSRVYQMEPLPHNQDDFDLLVVMGGPQSPTTSMEACPHFDAKAEMNMITEAIAANKRVLGVCLGAQLIGQALGANCETSPNKEIGLFPLILTKNALADPLFSMFPETIPAGHWHGDMPGLTKDAVILAYSEGCPRQVIRYAPNVYGFQCHFEFTQEAIEGMIEHCGDELVKQKGVLPYVQTVDELRENNYQAVNRMLFKFLDNWCVDA